MIFLFEKTGRIDEDIGARAFFLNAKTGKIDEDIGARAKRLHQKHNTKKKDSL